MQAVIVMMVKMMKMPCVSDEARGDQRGAVFCYLFIVRALNMTMHNGIGNGVCYFAASRPFLQPCSCEVMAAG